MSLYFKVNFVFLFYFSYNLVTSYIFKKLFIFGRKTLDSKVSKMCIYINVYFLFIVCDYVKFFVLLKLFVFVITKKEIELQKLYFRKYPNCMYTSENLKFNKFSVY